MAQSSGDNKMPPHNRLAEMSVLGAAMLDPGCLPVLRERISAESFYVLSHQDIWTAICEAVDAGQTPDLVILQDRLTKTGKLEKIGGVQYLMEVLESVPCSANAENYGSIVQEHHLRRRLLAFVSDVAAKGNEWGVDVERWLADTQEQVASLQLSMEPSSGADIVLIVDGLWRELQDRAKNPGLQHDGLPTGFHDLDYIFGGLRPGELTVLGAFPGDGKTTFAVNLLASLCVQKGHRCIFFSAEMSGEEVVRSLICRIAGVDPVDYRRGQVAGSEDRLRTAHNEVKAAPLVIEDKVCVAVDVLYSRAVAHCRRQPVELIVVDYIQQLMPARKRQSAVIELAETAKMLKAVARDCNAHVLALSQFARLGNKPGRPRMSSLYGSGGIEQAADVVIVLDAVEKRQKGEEQGEVVRRDFHVDKDRHGPVGGCSLNFRKHVLRFENMAREGGEHVGRDDPKGERGSEAARKGREKPAVQTGFGDQGDRGGENPSVEEADGAEDGYDVPESEIPF